MDVLTKLSNASLARLPETVLRPNYDRSGLKAGIVHIGVGNFHRAHQAWYLHRLIQQGQATDWAIIGAGVRSYDAQMRDKLNAQDYLTTLIKLDPNGQGAEIVGSMIDYLPIEPGNAPLIAAMANPAIRIVSLTVTESGYFIDPASREFDTSDADIQHDIANPQQPRTAFGAIVQALKQRKQNGAGPFTIQSCDNLQGNGTITRQTVVSLAAQTDPELADWIDQNCTFPNSMVDCIVPATGPREIDLAKSLGIDDAAPVTHESFRQWVIEDKFCAGRPDFDQVGATFADRVHDYETMKIRILNAGHQILANAGELLSIDTIAGCMANPAIAGLFEKIQHDEIAPHVGPVPGMTAPDYIRLIQGRFANPLIHDTTRRVAFDGSSRHPGFLLPILRQGLQKGVPIEGLTLVEAIWARMCEGSREDGSLIEANDPDWQNRNQSAKIARNRPKAWLEQTEIYGDLAETDAFAGRFTHWLQRIWQSGTEAAIQDYIGKR